MEMTISPEQMNEKFNKIERFISTLKNETFMRDQNLDFKLINYFKFVIIVLLII